MNGPDWDDDRLAAAFHARFDRSAPTDLAAALHGAVSGISPARLPRFRPASSWAMAAAAVVLAVVGGAAVLGFGGLGRPGGGPSDSGAVASSGVNPNNEAVSVGGSAAPSGPPPSAAPWPPAGATVVTLTSQVGAEAPPAQVAAVDESGRLTGVTEKGVIDPATVPFDGRFGAYAEPGKPGRVHLEWIGGICDKRITVTVAADLKAITFDMGPIVDCDSIGIGRQLVLDFSGSVDVPAIALGDATAGLPAASERGYTLDCGTLGPDTCETKAAAIVAAALKESPPKRVIAVRLSDDPCGSFTVDFDDGTSRGTIIDCFIPPSPS